MKSIAERAACGAGAALFAALSSSYAFAHAVCGDRIFPATLAIDDPGVTDEFAITWDRLPKSDGGQVEYDANVSWAKTIFPNFALSIQTGPSWITTTPQAQGGYGWDDIVTEAKYQAFCFEPLELMGSVGFTIDWGNTGTNGMAASSTLTRP